MAMIPKTLKILGRRIKVRMVEVLGDAVAEWSAGDYRIDVLKDQEALDEAEALLHEAMHSILHCQGREYGGDVEESYVRPLASGLLIVLRENPKLVEFLTRKVDT